MDVPRYQAEAEPEDCEPAELRARSTPGLEAIAGVEKRGICFHAFGLGPCLGVRSSAETEHCEARIPEAASVCEHSACTHYHLRHTAATLGIAAGVSVKVIFNQFGHASISFMMERYSHAFPSTQDDAAAKLEQFVIA